MRKEIWFGKEYQVLESLPYAQSCQSCAFYDAHECEKVDCIPGRRSDERDVYFVEIDTETTDPEHNAHTSRGWMEMAAQGQRDVQFYQGILDQIGELLGIAAYTSDDGSIQDSVLRLKLPDLVAKLVYENTLLKTKNASLEFERREF